MLLCLDLNARSGWYWQNPLPQGNDLYDISFVGTSRGWAVGDHGYILHSDDGGLNWTQQNSTTTYELHAVYFINSNTGWAVGINGTLLHWDGNSWQSQDSKTSSHLFDIHFINTTTGWVVGQDQTVLFTNDGGSNWTQVGFTGTNHYFSVYFHDQNNGYLVGATGSYGIINHTKDGGATWTRELLPTNRLNSIHFADQNSGWAVGDNGIIFYKAHADSGWTNQFLGATADLLSVHASSSDKIWASGRDGLIYHSENGGSNWLPQDTTVTHDIRSVFMLDASSGWATGRAGTILRTNNGGTDWQRLNTGPTGYLRDISFNHPNLGIVVGDTGLIYISDDGGSTWEKDSCGTDVDLYSVDFSRWINDYDPIVTGYGGTILRNREIEDSSGYWEPKYWTSHEDLFDFKAWGRLGWATGQFGTIVYTANKGFSWDLQHQDMGYHLYGIDFPISKYGWAVGMQGTILHTKDRGENWTEQTSPIIANLQDVHFTDSKTGWAVGTYGIIIYTIDGGRNWLQKENVTDESLISIYFTDRNNGWIVGFHGTILHTSNGGETWAHQWSGTDNDLNSVYFSDPATGWICGENGTILHTEDGGGFTFYYLYPRIDLGKDILDFQIVEDSLWVGSSKKLAQTAGLLGVEVLIDSVVHPSIGDLEFTLSHNGITDTLIYQTGAGESNIFSLKLSDAATLPVDSGAGPFTGAYKPYKPLSAFAGLDPNGAWILKIYDGADGNTGQLHSWSLKIYTEEITAIEPIKVEIPAEFALYQNYPNPFNPVTTIKYNLTKPGNVDLSIYNILGQIVATLISENQSAGIHKVEWDASGIASGLYFYRLQTEQGFGQTKKLILIR